MKARNLIGMFAAGVLSASVAHAAPFYLDIGIDVNGDGSTQTSSIDELGYTGTLATSIYLGDPGVAGTTVIDTNIASVMNAYGFAPGTYTAIDGTTSVDFQYTDSPGQNNIDALNFTGGSGSGNGFVSGVGGFPNDYGSAGVNGTTWGITYDYHIQGVTTATGVDFTQGFFDVYYENGTDRTQVLRLNVTGSEINPTNLDIIGDVTFDFNGDGVNDALGNTFIQNMFVDIATGMSFYDLWLVGEASGLLSIAWIVDTNVNPPLPSADQLVQFVEDGALFRQTTLDGSVTFDVQQVPEPASLALLGLGLLGLGAMRRMRS